MEENLEVQMSGKMRLPFGEADCESELKAMGGKASFSRLYFDETRFNEAAMKTETYLIVGRRGSGKTALSQYFSFQDTVRNPIYIDVDEPAIYQEVLSNISAGASEIREVAIPRLKKVWEYILWRVILEHTKNEPTIVAEAKNDVQSGRRASHFINDLIDGLLKSLRRDRRRRHIGEHVENLLSDASLSAAKKEALRLARRRPIIIAVDTLEKYDVGNTALMNAMAALVQCAADFSLSYREEGIHLKVFMSGEVFPYLTAEVIQNPLKSVKEPVYLFWSSKDLLRLIGWRLYHYLKERDLLRDESTGKINWANHQDVRLKMWDPYFGKTVKNRRGSREDTLSYVLRHTQKRPRQVIMLCNAIAERALRGRSFPVFSEEDIKVGVRERERELATEIINSYSELYPQVSKIVNGLMNIPMRFEGSELDRRAHETTPHWPGKSYSKSRFRTLVAELGIVGRVVREEKDYINAVFEYSLPDSLELTHRDECVIHPMFYSRFNVKFNVDGRVIPVPTELELGEQGEEWS